METESATNDTYINKRDKLKIKEEENKEKQLSTCPSVHT